MPSPAINGELVGQKLGKYELLALIAVGGTAEIYLARISGASGFEKYLVVKCLLDHLADDQEFVRMFLDEARVSAQLDHSNIVQTLELGEHNGRYFLVMEYLAGMSVAQMARKTQERGVTGGLIDPNLVLGLASQTCSGLHYAHSKTMQGKSLNLVHRDISPQNLVVSYEGILKIVDFGIAKSDIREVQTRTGTIKGKFAYMSPEQCLAKKVDHRTDIFALGTLCHELLTGRRLFKRQTTYDTYQAIVNGGVPPPSKINPKLDKEVDKVIMKALAYTPEERYDSSQAFGEAILELLHHRGGSAGPGEISRFFDQHFYEDLEAHADQMRELITGKKKEVPDGSWDSDFHDVMPPEGRPMSEGQSNAQERRAAPRGKLGSIPTILPAAPDPNIDATDEDEGPTRIEFNPGERIAAIHDDADIDQSWTEETMLAPETGPGSAPDSAKAASLGASPMGHAEMAGSRSGPGMPPVPPVRTPPPPPNARSTKDFATPPATIDVQEFNRNAPPNQGAKMTLLGQQAPIKGPNAGQHGPGPGAMGGQDGQGSILNAGGGSGAPIGSTPLTTAPPNQVALARPQLDNSHGFRQQQNPGYPSSAQHHTGPLSGVTTNRPLGGTPLWMHGAVFAVFLGLGLGIAAFIKSLL